MNNRLLVFILACLFSQYAFSQRKGQALNVDSLLSEFHDTSLPDSIRLENIYKVSWGVYLFSKPDSAFYYAGLHLDLAKELNNEGAMALAYNTMGVSNYLRGNLDQALYYYELGIEHARKANDYNRVSGFLTNMGLVYNQLGQFEKANDHYTQSLRIAQELNNETSMANAYNNLGNLFYVHQEYAKALDYYLKSLYYHTINKNKKNIASCLNNIGNIYREMGDAEQSLNYFQQSLTLKQEIKDKGGIAATYLNIGIAYAQNSEFDIAMDYFQKSLTIREETLDKKNIAMCLNDIGNLYIDQKQYDQAIPYLFRSMEIREITGDQRGLSTTNYNLALVYFNTEKTDTALIFANKAYDIANELNAVKEKCQALKMLYTMHLHENNTALARTYISELVQVRNKNLKDNFFTLSEKEKQLYFLTLESDFNNYLDFSFEHRDEFLTMTDTAMNLILQNKGLTLKSSSTLRSAILESNDSLLLLTYDEWISYKNELAQGESRREEIDNLEHIADSLERELISKSGAFSELYLVENLDWKQIRDRLKPHEAAIEFTHFKSEIDTLDQIYYLAFLITPECEHPAVIKLCSEADLKVIFNITHANNLNFVEQVYGKKQDNRTQLYQTIWKPLESYLINSKTIYYSPSGLLHKVSFTALRDEAGIYLSDRFHFRQVGSTGSLIFDKDSKIDLRDNFLVMGGIRYNSDTSERKVWDYLPGSYAESESIQNYLQGKKIPVRYFSGADADEATFKQEVVHSSILHIATHGFFFPDPEQVREELKKQNATTSHKEDLKFRTTTNYADWSFVNNKNPLMRSGIVLAHANDVWQRSPLAEGEDGILTAQEVSTLDLRATKLIVLSACETGLGDIKGSEGVFGLQRAFKMAGAKYMIMSLWQVPDEETSEFMTLFYQNLIQGKDIPKAFYKTQKQLREKYDPYYWGAFILIE